MNKGAGNKSVCRLEQSLCGLFPNFQHLYTIDFSTSSQFLGFLFSSLLILFISHEFFCVFFFFFKIVFIYLRGVGAEAEGEGEAGSRRSRESHAG